MTDDALQQLVSEELFWDPKVDSGAIAATAADGVVTLRGTVGSFREKREARKAAMRVYGVTSVNNELGLLLIISEPCSELPLRFRIRRATVTDPAGIIGAGRLGQAMARTARRSPRR
jgi:BON domain